LSPVRNINLSLIFHDNSILLQTLSEEQRLLKCVYSMIIMGQINFYLYQMEAGITGWGIHGREGERERERIKGERDRA